MTVIIENQIKQIENLTQRNICLAEYNDDLHHQICTLQTQITDLQAQLDELVRENSRPVPIISLEELYGLTYGTFGPINRIKLIRKITGCGLREAKDFYDANLMNRVMKPAELHPLVNAE
jgi:hypothetical protein